MIKRTSLENINSILAYNTSWNILDVGCGYNAHPKATTICDVLDLSNYYKEKNFIQLKENKLPFRDKQFDFVIASHVIEHVEDVVFFISELERISQKGYIELPTKLEDNLVFENKKDHLWHMDFDDVNYKLVVSKKIQYFEPVLTVSTIKKINKFFKKSLILELYWEEKIDFVYNEFELIDNKKISLLSLLRKYISNKIRMFFK